MTGAKMRVYEIAKEVGIPNKDLIAKIRALGLEVNNHMSSLDADDVARIRRSLEKEKQSVTQPQQTQRLATGGAVLRRRASGDKPSDSVVEGRRAEAGGARASEPAHPQGLPPASGPQAPAVRPPPAGRPATRPDPPTHKGGAGAAQPAGRPRRGGGGPPRGGGPPGRGGGGTPPGPPPPPARSQRRARLHRPRPKRAP